jgi:hypothetical protein
VTISGSHRALVLAISATGVCVLEIVALIGHVQRPPDDHLGIALYSMVVAALAAGAIWATIGWVHSREEAGRRLHR